MKIGIVGYGNVGKNLVKLAEIDNAVELVGVFSRRNLTIEKYEPLKNLDRFIDKIDVLLLAIGSYCDIENNIKLFENFHTVDSFDNHQNLEKYKKLLQSTKQNKLSLVGIGWDPGILSMARGILALDNIPTTIWGEGVSQGHSNALRNIKGVLDAVSFTIPKENALSISEMGNATATQLHKRLCYVACVTGCEEEVYQQIINMPHYFENYEVEIHFCSISEVKMQKQKCYHKGQVVSVSDGYRCHLQLEMKNNANFTAKIMLKYAKILPRLLQDGYCGILDVFDIPLKYLSSKQLI